MLYVYFAIGLVVAFVAVLQTDKPINQVIAMAIFAILFWPIVIGLAFTLVIKEQSGKRQL
jgi:predicted lysophospholipase L1 biosynthesis ABC-type transport system permease subunit